MDEKQISSTQPRTEVKHQPATPLPWLVKSNARNLTVYGRKKDHSGLRPFVDEVPLENWGDEAERLRKDLTFAFRSANAYPKLVGALRHLLDTNCATCPTAEAITEARALARHVLRDLGEAS